MESYYGLETQKEIFFAYCILYNYLTGVDPKDTILAQIDNKLQDEADKEYQASRENNKKHIQ